MSKQKTPKREKLYARKQWVARRFVIFLIALLAVNHLMQLGFLLPIQAIRQGEERQGRPTALCWTGSGRRRFTGPIWCT